VDSVVRIIEIPASERSLRLTVGIGGAGANGFAGLNYISEQMMKDFLTTIGVAPLVTPRGKGPRPEESES
jgi:hypothetical protein